MADSEKEATKAAPAPSGKGAAKGGVEKKAKAASVKKKGSKTSMKRAAAATATDKTASGTEVKKSRRGRRNRRVRAGRKGARAAARKGDKAAAEKVKKAPKTPKAPKRSASASKDDPPAKRKRRPHREIASGVMKFSRPYKFRRGANWKFVGKKIKKATPKKPRTIKKEIGGEKNGGFRIVLLKKRRNNYPTADKIRKRPTRSVFKKHVRYTRKSLKPGTICILLAGIHKGRRVVLLKVLKSGLLLVNGPYSVNGVPLRRVSQNFVIATRTRLDISGEKLPLHLNDEYFRRIRPKKSKKDESDIFTTKKEKYTPSDQRKADQKIVDAILINAMKKFGKRGKQYMILQKYLKAMFGLRRNQNPHCMKF